MAEAEQSAEGRGQPASSVAGRGKLIVIVGIAAVLALGGGSAYVLGLFGGGEEAQAAKHGSGAETEHGEAGAAGEGTVATLESFVVNLADPSAQRYLKVTMKVEFFGGQVPGRFGTRDAQIRDLVLTLLSSKTVDDVRTVEGKSQLRDEIIARINRVLGEDAVKAIYFAEFIVQ